VLARAYTPKDHGIHTATIPPCSENQWFGYTHPPGRLC
jgi:hypothetical protein